MKVALIYLPHPYLNQPDAQAPLGLIYLAQVLMDNNIQVELCNFSSYFTYEALQELPDADLYGITVTSFEIPQANRFAHLIKEKYFKRKVILGGPGTISEEFVDWNVIDSICVGDGEKAILEIVKDFATGNLKNKYIGESVSDLDEIAFPARELLKSKQGGNIFAYNENYKDGGSTIILSTRGCPFNCSFCTAPFLRTINKKVRFRSAQNVADEIKQVVDKYNIRQFRFSDDMFTASRKRVFELCEKLKDMDIVWRISCRVKPFDEEMAQVMFDAGCKEMSFGIESFDDNVLKYLNKDATAEDNVKALEICAKIGIKTRILFMIRTPGQTKDTVRINIEYLEKVPFDIVACTSFVPIPGCDIWNNPDKYNVEILDKNLDNYNFYFFSSHGENELKDIIKIKGRSLEELREETQRFRDYIKSTGKLNEG